MSRQARGGLFFLVCAGAAVLSLALAFAPSTPTEIRPLLAWAVLVSAFGALAALLEMGGTR